MSIQCLEKMESPQGWTNSPTRAGGEMLYVIMESAGAEITREQAINALSSAAAASIVTGTYTVYHKSVKVEPVNLSMWLGSVSYEADPVAGDKNDYEFDTTGGTMHITHDIDTVATYGTGAPDVSGAINTNAGSIDGVDITVPVFAFSETHHLSIGTVDAAYKNTIRNLTGKVNSAEYKGHAAGELLFLGARGNRRSGEDWTITFYFAASENKTGLTVAGISGIAKKGWEYVSVLTKPVTSGDITIQETVAVYVHQVYHTAAFTGLGI